MTYIFVKHRVEDYDRWKAVFDEHAAVRKEHGSTGARVLRDANDPQEVVVITEWQDMEHAQQFAQDPDLLEVMQRAGVTGAPDIFFLEETDQQPA